MTKTPTLYPLLVALAACGVEPSDPAELAAATGELAQAPVLVHAGTDQILHAVTDDDHALYQEGQTLYATALDCDAPRTVVAQIPGTNIPQVLQVGKVVFVWTDPQRNLPGFGVSPLVLWTAEHGPRLISAQSSVGLVATAASDDSRQLVFTTNVLADGSRGDLVYARTETAQAPVVLAANIPLGFPSGPCRPLAGFVGSGTQAVAAAYCPGTDTTATLSTWTRKHGALVKRDLAKNIRVPMPFILQTDPERETFLLTLADGTLRTVTTGGETRLVDTANVGAVFLGRKDTAGYVVRNAAPPNELRVAPRNQAPVTVGPVVGFYSNTYNRAGYFRSRTTSKDGRLALYTSTLDAVGLGDARLLDVRDGTAVALRATVDVANGSEIFTQDSRHALFFSVPDLTTGTGVLLAGDRDGNVRALSSDASAFDVYGARGSAVSFLANPTFTAPRLGLLSTGDLYVVDADTSAAPRLVSVQAGIQYLPTGDRGRVVFASATEPGGPGLYVASAKP